MSDPVIWRSPGVRVLGTTRRRGHRRRRPGRISLNLPRYEEGARVPAGSTVPLRDGSRVVIRPIEPEDREALAEGFRRLSPESRYRRFFGPVTRLSERDLDYLTRVDHQDHEALVAVEESTGEGVGVARYIRTGRDVAEAAIVVADGWQRRGVGTALLAALVKRARQEGIGRFEATVLAYNEDAIQLLERLGHTTRAQLGREVELKIDLPELEPTARVGPVLGQFAIGTLEPARALLEGIPSAGLPLPASVTREVRASARSRAARATPWPGRPTGR